MAILDWIEMTLKQVNRITKLSREAHDMCEKALRDQDPDNKKLYLHTAIVKLFAAQDAYQEQERRAKILLFRNGASLSG